MHAKLPRLFVRSFMIEASAVIQILRFACLPFFSFSFSFPPCFCLFDLFLIFNFFSGGLFLAFTYEAVHVSSLWGLSVRPRVCLSVRACGKEANSFFLFAVGREIFSGGCTSLFGWHFTVDGFVRSSAWFSSWNDGAHPFRGPRGLGWRAGYVTRTLSRRLRHCYYLRGGDVSTFFTLIFFGIATGLP